MRGSIHLLPRETAHLAFRALPEPPKLLAQRMRYFGLTEERYAELRDAVLAACSDEPLTSSELREATGAGKEMNFITGSMARQGALRRVGAEGLRSNALRYLAEPVPPANTVDALAWLAEEYLRAFGPARREDFRWWTGATAAAADAALASVDTQTLDGGLLVRSVDREGFERAEPLGDTLDVLPKWDAYAMGYPAGARGRFADPGVADRLYDFRGDGRPLVLAGGSAIAAWESRFKGKRMEIDLELFETPGARLGAALDERFEELGALLGAAGLEVRRV